MSLNELNPNSDLQDEGGRWQLQVTLDKISRAISELRTDISDVEDRIPPAAKIEFPHSGTWTYSNARLVGEIFMMGKESVPTGALECDGTAKSRTTYAELFRIIGTSYGVGDGSTTFNLPDHRGRSPQGVGNGSASGATDQDLADEVGKQTLTLTTTELPAHSHYDEHTHSIQHSHEVADGLSGGGGSLYAHAVSGPQATQVWGSLNGTDTGGANPNTSGIKSSGPNTSSTAAASAFDIRGPRVTHAFYIQAQRNHSDAQFSWGPIPGNWVFESAFNVDSVSNVQLATSAAVRATSNNGTGSGNTSATKITGLIRCPQTFAGWAHSALKVKTRMNITGCSGSATVTLKVFNPLSSSGYLSGTASRTVSASGSTISDSEEKTLTITAEDMGEGWGAGYPLRFEIDWGVPATHTLCQLDIGELQILWE